MAKKSSHTTKNGSEIVLYHAENGKFQLLLRLENDSVWLTLNQIAELYQSSKQNISSHIQKILMENELEEWATVKKNLTVQTEQGKQVHRKLTYYNLEMILSVGYRVKSIRGTQFRMWATQHLSEYLVKGFVLDDERLKGSNRITDYFDELLSRIRDIRASEARVYQRVREIFALASDYSSSSQESQLFFAVIWKGNRVTKGDIITAKNYLDEKEIDTLNRIVVMFLDQAEFRVLRRQDIKTQEWEVFLDKFLNDNELPILTTPGNISHEKAVLLAEQQYESYSEKRRLEAEELAESKYLEDLKTSVKAVAAKRKKK